MCLSLEGYSYLAFGVLFVVKCLQPWDECYRLSQGFPAIREPQRRNIEFSCWAFLFLWSFTMSSAAPSAHFFSVSKVLFPVWFLSSINSLLLKVKDSCRSSENSGKRFRILWTVTLIRYNWYWLGFCFSLATEKFPPAVLLNCSLRSDLLNPSSFYIVLKKKNSPRHPELLVEISFVTFKLFVTRNTKKSFFS